MRPLLVLFTIALFAASECIDIDAGGRANADNTTQMTTENAQRKPIDPRKPGGPRIVLSRATVVFGQLTAARNQQTFRVLLDKAECIAIVPSLTRDDQVNGVRYAKGIIMCRDRAGDWGGPLFIQLEGKLNELRSGYDIVILVMDRRYLLGESAFFGTPLGVEVSSYESRAFVHSSLGYLEQVYLRSTVMTSDDENEALAHGRDQVLERYLLDGTIPTLSDAIPLVVGLSELSPRGRNRSR